MSKNKYYIAPLEGVTGYIFRNAHYDLFHPADKYFSPFITPGINSTRKSKALKDVLPENNHGPRVIPQILTNRSDEFIFTANQLKELGYDEMNLNLGCPSGTVVGKRRGAGFLPFVDELDRFLNEIYEQVDLKISIKTRIGKDKPEEFENLLHIYQQYPVEELIIHPRTREEYYKGQPHLEIFETAMEQSKLPLCYNGNVFKPSDAHKIWAQFPKLECQMIGRGIVANPFLLDMILDEGKEVDRERLRQFHDRLLEDYKEIMSGDTPLLFKMKEMWTYMIHMFEDTDKMRKKIRKVQKLKDYAIVVEELFGEYPLKKMPSFDDRI